MFYQVTYTQGEQEISRGQFSSLRDAKTSAHQIVHLNRGVYGSDSSRVWRIDDNGKRLEAVPAEEYFNDGIKSNHSSCSRQEAIRISKQLGWMSK